jgi:hypothetical protein
MSANWKSVIAASLSHRVVDADGLVERVHRTQSFDDRSGAADVALAALVEHDL